MKSYLYWLNYIANPVHNQISEIHLVRCRFVKAKFSPCWLHLQSAEARLLSCQRVLPLNALRVAFLPACVMPITDICLPVWEIVLNIYKISTAHWPTT